MRKDMVGKLSFKKNMSSEDIDSKGAAMGL